MVGSSSDPSPGADPDPSGTKTYC